MPSFVIAAAVNNEEVLKHNLLASPCLKSRSLETYFARGAKSASCAYNEIIDATSGEYIIFAHQDVYLPSGWIEKLEYLLAELETSHPEWALLSPFGISQDNQMHRGTVWSSSLGAVVGEPVGEPVEAQSFDELLFVMKRSSGLRFDEKLPNFHMYGTDIVQTARQSGKKALIVELPVIHNDSFHEKLGWDFTESFKYIQKKWKSHLPLTTPCVRISWHNMTMPIENFRMWRSREKRRKIAQPISRNPKEIAAECGWED